MDLIDKDSKQVIWSENIPLPIDELSLSFGMYKLNVILKNQNKENPNYSGLLNINDKSEETIGFELWFDGKWFKVNEIESSNINLVERVKCKIDELVNNLVCDSNFNEIWKNRS